MSNNTVQQRNVMKEPVSESEKPETDSDKSIPELTPKQVEELEKLEVNIKKLLEKQKEKEAEKKANTSNSRKKIIEAEIADIDRQVQGLQARKAELQKELAEHSTVIDSHERGKQLKGAQQTATDAGETVRSFFQNLGTGGGKKQRRRTRRTRRKKKHTRRTKKNKGKTSKKHHKKVQKKRRSGKKH